MGQAYVHEAELELAVGADMRAPGAAVTVGLCGHWGHEGACRWRHHTAVQKHSEQHVTLRTLFISEPHEDIQVGRGGPCGRRYGLTGD